MDYDNLFDFYYIIYMRNNFGIYNWCNYKNDSMTKYERQGCWMIIIGSIMFWIIIGFFVYCIGKLL
jgi:hypothetical protein